jgi:hypothetical protein
LERREDTHDNSIIDTQFEIETQWAKKFGYKKKYDNCDVIIRVRLFFLVHVSIQICFTAL